ncbi:enoyl-CoA hydratase [Sphingopyxis bauzanensis]|jgi:2-(1,2-epoxy-1,2-dihydrophenyl)acetyl-CoA isomerase|uniref:Enoyl-CoA hydratase n=1 Tax=Sphingopyxis bauzanensis TaxID=651663 RepID=A0A246JUZ1_9SPHN|nr:enoyl-CoA hydratase-related protein [Sphingopyxis bauzanensis]OWQ96813.1 enoyl-CoA hydratase [Sphingopyxis bauzanensis]GGJ57681.1 enoyl-CoA hydratase [Sphingopyxis bauzanensis]
MVLNIKREGRVAVLKLNRPDSLNALSGDLHDALNAAVADVALDESVGCVVVTGAGRAFCAGGDTRSGAARDTGPKSQEQRVDAMVHHAETVRLLHLMPKPTLAIVNGAAAGAGLALALACDMRIAASDAMMTTAYVRLALSGDFGCTYFLTRLVGPAIAAELMFLSEKIAMDRALQLGLVNRVMPSGDLLAEGMRMANELAAMPPVTLRLMKRNIAAASHASLDEMIEREATAMVRCTKTQDAKEALAARREGRPAVFVGY